MTTTYIILLGPPGAGKGTQADIVSEKLALVHISSGDIFRENLKQQTRGELVPDDVTIAMIRERLARPDCANGALLDGFPRTPAQADALAEMLGDWGRKINNVLYISVQPEALIERLGGRWTCREQNHVYHQKYNPPQKAGVCDLDGSELYQREDDKPATVENRIRVYLAQTSPLIEYYRQVGLLTELDGTQPIEQVSAQLLAAIEKGK
jgi:adenylate kinase